MADLPEAGGIPTDQATDREADGPSPTPGFPATDGPASPPGFSPPKLVGRHVYLRPVSPEDYGFLRRMDLAPELGARWRFRGATPLIEQWVRDISSRLVHFLVVRSIDHQPIGVTDVYQHNFQDQHAQIAAASFEPSGRSPLLLMGLVMCVEYTFTCWPLRKLYFDVAEYNVSQYATAIGTLIDEEGRLREHVYYDGRYWDTLIFALYRRTWEERSSRLLAAALPPPRKVGTVSLSPNP